jgi:hypothetical protein
VSYLGRTTYQVYEFSLAHGAWQRGRLLESKAASPSGRSIDPRAGVDRAQGYLSSIATIFDYNFNAIDSMLYINDLNTTGNYMVPREFVTTLPYYVEFSAGTETHNDTTFIVQFTEWKWYRINLSPPGSGSCSTYYCYTYFSDSTGVHSANRVEAYFHLSVHPPVQVSISGEDTITLAGQYEWMASATGGSGSYTYQWERNDDEGWYSAGTASTYTAVVDTGHYAFDLRVIASSVGKSDTATHHVTVEAPEYELTLPPIGGATSIESEGEYEWTAEPSGGTGQFSYEWYYKVHMWYPKPYPTTLCEADWELVGTDDSYSRYVYDDEFDFYIKVVVTSGTQEVYNSKKVYPFDEEDPMCWERR